MRRSTDRILTTHTGSLPRPPELLALVRAKLAGEHLEEGKFALLVQTCVSQTVKRQADLGLDVINDGEMSKPSFLSYIVERLDGVQTTNEPSGNPWAGSRETLAFPEYYEWEASLNLNPGFSAKRVVCNAPIRYKGHKQLQADIANLKAAIGTVNVADAFLPAISPANVEAWIKNDYYATTEEYLFALADALREEYKSILDSGLLLQVDDPRLVTQYVVDARLTMEEYRRWASLRIDALNHALRDLPQDRIRFHTCYSIDMGPRTNDVELENVIDLILRIRAGAYSFEASNPRHEHEWKVWSKIDLDESKILIPGVITNSTVVVEHPELVCDRILRFAQIVGRERVIAGSDCGFAAFAGMMSIHPTIAWAKLGALVKGAEMASRKLWRG